MLGLFQRIFHASAGYKLFYFGGRKSKNAGDTYNIDLMNYFGIEYTRSKKIRNADLMCVGSNLDRLFIASKRKLLIAGAGFIMPPEGNDYLKREVEILALRGELSRKRMENLTRKSLTDCILGDPGILISKIYPLVRKNKKYRLGIIPHYNDKDQLDNEKIRLKSTDYKIIDIQQDAKCVAEEISECEYILSSSLHGLIFADSYNIPNKRLIISGELKGGNYKFADYYSAFGLELPESVDVRIDSIEESIFERIKKDYIPKNISEKQLELSRVFQSIPDKTVL